MGEILRRIHHGKGRKDKKKERGQTSVDQWSRVEGHRRGKATRPREAEGRR